MSKKLMVIVALFISSFVITSCGTGDVDTETAQTNLSNNTAIETTPEPENAHIVQIGETLQFGGYDWRVLDVQDGRVLIISDRIITRQAYCSGGYSTWETSDIREWLNGSFYETNFAAEERVRIAETRIVNNDNPWFDTYGGADTMDKIFLLSIEEVVAYFGDSGQLDDYRPRGVMSIDDQYNSARIAYDSDGTALWWWLRSPGFFCDVAAGVNATGRLDIDGHGVNVRTTWPGIRPALWLYIES